MSKRKTDIGETRRFTEPGECFKDEGEEFRIIIARKAAFYARRRCLIADWAEKRALLDK